MPAESPVNVLQALATRFLPVLFEDDDLLAVAKPAGVDASADRPGAAPGVLEILAASRRTDESLSVVRRLTRYESGVLLLAKRPASAKQLKADLRGRKIEQEVVAVCLGSFQPRRRVVTASRGRAEGARGRVAGRRVPDPAAGREVTHVEHLQSGPKRCMIRFRARAETTHVLRAALRGAGLRLLGDNVHERSVRRQDPAALCLHLASVAFFHPVQRRKVLIRATPPAEFREALRGLPLVERHLQGSLLRRSSLLLDESTDGYRLLTGPAEGLSSLVAERLGRAVVLSVSADDAADADLARRVAHWYRRHLDIDVVYAKVPFGERGDDAAPRMPLVLAGEPGPAELVVREHGLRFLVRVDEKAGLGLFFDHRDNRRRVRELAAGRDVLNLFAYTCGFSVAAAVGKCRQVVSVDISPKALVWGQRNFEINELDAASHEFVRADARDYLERAVRRQQQFDLVLVDPPTFSHGRHAGRAFSLVADLPALMARAVEVLRPGGVLMVATNYRKLSRARFRQLIRQGVAPRPHTMDMPPLPPDFAVDPDHAKTAFVTLI